MDQNSSPSLRILDANLRVKLTPLLLFAVLDGVCMCPVIHEKGRQESKTVRLRRKADWNTGSQTQSEAESGNLRPQTASGAFIQC